MSIEGRIAVDVSFADKADGTSVQAIKKISLVDTASYTSGKVAVVTGTCGTTDVSVSINPGTYRDAGGSVVNFSSVSRFAFAATPGGVAYQEGDTSKVVSKSGQIAITSPSQSDIGDFLIAATAGTASYTLVIYGT